VLLTVLRFPLVDQQGAVLLQAGVRLALGLDIREECFARLADRNARGCLLGNGAGDFPIADDFIGPRPIAKVEALVDARAGQISVHPDRTAAVVVPAVSVCTLAGPVSARLNVAPI
jgi:hypothetical protein